MEQLTALVAALARVAEPWRELFDRSRGVSIAVTFVHLAALVVAGGLALSADRATLAAARDPGRRAGQLAALGAAHRTVGIGLAGVLASGVLLALADVETFATSPIFWGKMTLVALLLANGLRMQRAGRTLAADPTPEDGGALGWRRLRACAVASGALWFAVILLGTALAEW